MMMIVMMITMIVMTIMMMMMLMMMMMMMMSRPNLHENTSKALLPTLPTWTLHLAKEHHCRVKYCRAAEGFMRESLKQLGAACAVYLPGLEQELVGLGNALGRHGVAAGSVSYGSMKLHVSVRRVLRDTLNLDLDPTCAVMLGRGPRDH